MAGRVPVTGWGMVKFRQSLVAALAAALVACPALAQLPAAQDRPLSAAERTRLASLEVRFTRISAERKTSVAALRTIARAMGTRLTTLDPDDLVDAIDARARELGAARQRIGELEGELSSLDSMRLARDVSKKIEESMEYPGQIKVTVVRETRATEYAR